MTVTSTNIGIRPFTQFQLGKEVTPGTSVVATALIRGKHTMQDDRKIVVPSENVGVFWNTTRNYAPSTGATLTMPEIPATFEQLPYLGEAGIKALYTGVADGGGGTGKIYTYPFPTTRAAGRNSINSFSLETGDDLEAWFANYGIVKSMKLSGKYDDSVMMSGVFQSRAVAPNFLTASTIAFDNAKHITDSASGLAIFPIGSRIIVSGTVNNNGVFNVTASAAGSLTVTENTATEAAGTPFSIYQTHSNVAVPAVQTMQFNQSKLYIDAVAGSWGGTQKTGTFLGFEWNFTTGWSGQPAGDGRLDFSFAKFALPSGNAKVTMVHEATAKAEYANFRSGTPRLFRILNQGAALTTAGSVYSFYTMILDFVGVYTKFNPPAEDGGMNTIVAEIQCAYDTTAASAGQLLCVNQLTALV